jgi:hypothetical protein
VTLYTVTRDEERHPPLALPSEIAGPDPLSYDSDQTAAYERAAAFGLSHVLFAKSPGGVVAAASRTATLRPMVEDAVSGSGIDADLLEAIVFLESAGRPDVIAGDDPEHASGLTQILAETATNFLDMRVDLAASRELTRQIAEAQARGDESAVERLQQERRRIDERFDPAQALAGTVRYLREARREFGRDDLAVVSYHMGIGNLAGVARAYSGRASDPIADVVREDDLSYARVYFDSSPTDHREAWQQLAAFGDDSQTYYWRVLAARDIMRLFREDPTRLERLSELHGRGASAELVLHPPRAVRRFAAPDALEAALRLGRLEQVPDDPARLHFRVDPRLEATVRDLGGDPRAYRAPSEGAAPSRLPGGGGVPARPGGEAADGDASGVRRSHRSFSDPARSREGGARVPPCHRLCLRRTPPLRLGEPGSGVPMDAREVRNPRPHRVDTWTERDPRHGFTAGGPLPVSGDGIAEPVGCQNSVHNAGSREDLQAKPSADAPHG